MQPADHGSQYSSLSTSEASGYARAMLDCIDWLTHQSEHATRPLKVAALQIAAVELSAYRNAKLSVPMQPLLTREAP